MSPLPTQNEAELTLWALNKTALNVAAEIKCNHALLMTSVYNEFLQTIKNCFKTCSVINPPSIRWVLAQIVLKLSPHLSFVCKVKREGTILYRNNGDIMCALSHSLAENKSHNCFSNTTSMVNNLLHEQSNSFTQQYKGHYQTLSEMSLDNIIASTNPELWKFLTQLTQSKRQRQRRSLSFSSHDVHTVRTLYCLCVLLFTTNPQCCVPIHLPLTDLILCHGGTTELVTVLNRFGAVASADTHSRFLQDLSADRKAMLDHNLSPNAFRIVSVDNIDVLQSHAQVYASDTHRSYHGTSIQCVEPLPKTCVNAHNRQVTDTEKRVHALTPSRSPSVLMERAKRMRMLQVAGIEQPLCASICTSMANEGVNHSLIQTITERQSTSVPFLSVAASQLTTIPLLSAAMSQSTSALVSQSMPLPLLSISECQSTSALVSQSMPLPLTTSQSTTIPLLSAAMSQSTSALVSQSMPLPLTTSQSTTIPLLSAAMSQSTSALVSQSMPLPLTTSQLTTIPLLSAAMSQSTSALVSQSMPLPLLSISERQSTSALVSQSMPLPLTTSQSTTIPLLSAAMSQSTSALVSQSMPLPLLSISECQSTSALVSQSMPLPLTTSQSTTIPLLSAAMSQSTSALVSQSMPLPLTTSQSTTIPLLSAAMSQSTSALVSQSTSFPLLSISECQSTSALVSQSMPLPLLSITERQSTSGTISAQLATHMSLTFTEFQQSVVERQAISQLEHKFFQYIVSKHSLMDKASPILFHFQQFLCTTSKNYQPTEKSNLTYLDILNEHADSKETILTVLELLESKYKVLRGDSQYLIVVGDAKTFNHLVSLKREQSEKFSWLLPFPGDWHILKNFHPVIINTYADAGLRQLAETSGFRAKTLTSLLSCNNFRLVHNFIIQLGEAVLRTMFTKFMNHRMEPFFNCSYESHSLTSDTIVNIIAQPMLNASTSDLIKPALLQVVDIMETGRLKSLHDEFNMFIDQIAQKDSTWKFWKGFIFIDFLAYLSLFTAVRTRNWNLRVASLKEIAPLVCAFDRPTYSKLVPDHIMDLLCLPSEISIQFEAGAFAVALGDRKSHCVGLDEAHEMGINKGIKQLVVRPTKDNMQRLATVMHHRAKIQNSLTSVAGTAYKEPQHSHHLPDKVTTKVSYTTKKIETNITKMMSTLQQSNTFEVVSSDRGLFNFMNGVKATPEQQRDLLTYHDIGDEDYENYVSYHLLHANVTNTLRRKRRLNTFSTAKKRKAKERQVQREKKLLEKCLRRRIQWIGSQGKVVGSLSEQLTSTPRALADEEGQPLKGTKSKTVEFLGKRYCDAPLLTSELPPNWHPHAVILEGMFLIHTSPLSHHYNIQDYAFYLLQRYALKHYQVGAIEVHIVFDDLGRLEVSPKVFERQHRDKGSESLLDHQHCLFEPELPRSQEWKNILKCRKCKRNLTESLANAMLQLAPSILTKNSRFITAGAFRGTLQDKAVMVYANHKVEIVEALESSVEEGDMRVWLHCKTSAGTKKIIYSPDTDTFHVGIGLLEDPRLSEYDIYVQLNKLGTTPKYIHLSSLQAALLRDPDLAAIPRPIKLQCLQTMYVVTGCDYTSFIHGFGKVSSLKTFFQHAAFISGHEYTGSLGDVTPSMQHLGFLSFARLVGTMYFKAHLDAFTYQTPHYTTA